MNDPREATHDVAPLVGIVCDERDDSTAVTVRAAGEGFAWRNARKS